MINYVRQEQSHGCGIASLAMVLGVGYWDVQRDWRLVVEKSRDDGSEYESRYNDFDKDGISHASIDSYLADKGYATMRKYRHQAHLRADRTDWPPKPFGPIHLCDVRTSMGHVVVMLPTGEVYDPALGAGRSLSDYEEVYSVAAVYRIRPQQDAEFLPACLDDNDRTKKPGTGLGKDYRTRHWMRPRKVE